MKSSRRLLKNRIFVALLGACFLFLAARGVRAQDAARNVVVGKKSVLVIRTDKAADKTPPVTTVLVTETMQDVSEHFREISHGKLLLQKPAVTPVYRLGANENPWDKGREIAKSNGFDDKKYDLVCLTHLDENGKKIWVLQGFGGSFRRGSFGFSSIVHEIGHALGLEHAYLWQTTDGTADGAGEMQDYNFNRQLGQFFDGMNWSGGHFNTRYENYLGWLPDEDVQIVTKSGLYRVLQHDNNVAKSGARALKIRESDNTNLWIEAMEGDGDNWRLPNGVLIFRTFNDSNKVALLSINSIGARRADGAPLLLGQTFSSAKTKAHVTPLKKVTVQQNGEEVSAMEVMINLGDFPGNRAPQAKITASKTQVKAGETVYFKVQSSDADNDALTYIWSFAPGQVGMLKPTASNVFTRDNSHASIFCITSDMKGGATPDSLVITVGKPATAAITGRITNNGQPVRAVRVQVTPKIVVYSDGSGTYTATGVPPGSYTLAASREGFSIAAGNAQVRLSAAKVTRLDFDATPDAGGVSAAP